MKFESMSDEQISTAIAERMGCYLKDFGLACRKRLTKIGEERALLDEEWNPTLNENLYQCWIFEEWMLKQDVWFDDSYGTSHNKFWVKYEECLYNICEIGKRNGKKATSEIHATAAQRCEAFYVTMGGKDE